MTSTAADPGETADRVVSAVLSVPGVTALHSGSFGEVGTHLPGRRVDGVRITDVLAEVHLVVGMHVPVLQVAEAVRHAVEPLVGTPVDVYVEDVEPG